MVQQDSHAQRKLAKDPTRHPAEEARDEGQRNERRDHSVQDEREAATPQQLLVFYENKGPFLLDWQELSLTHKVLLAQQVLDLL